MAEQLNASSRGSQGDDLDFLLQAKRFSFVSRILESWDGETETFSSTFQSLVSHRSWMPPVKVRNEGRLGVSFSAGA